MLDINIRKRFILFLIGCIGIRLFFTYLAKTTSQFNLQIMAYLALIISFTFFYFYFTNSRQTGFEVFGDKIWWNKLRPIHGLIYLLFAYNVLIKNPKAWIFLAIDVMFGFISFITYHYINGNFNKLF